jgi:hypothetical protein
MSRPIGLPKTGGRARGTPNHRTNDLKELIEGRLGSSIPEAILARLTRVSPRDQIRALMDLMAFVYPKRKPIEKPVEVQHSAEERKLEFMTAEELDAELKRLARKVLSVDSA